MQYELNIKNKPFVISIIVMCGQYSDHLPTTYLIRLVLFVILFHTIHRNKQMAIPFF
jgi:hypothetical protein